MTNVGIRRKLGAHLHEMNLFALLGQMNGSLTACQTAAENDHGIPDFFFFQIIIVDDDHIVPVDTLKGRNDGIGANSENHDIGIFLLRILRGNFRIAADLHTGLLCLCFQGKTKLIHFLFEIDGLLAF